MLLKADIVPLYAILQPGLTLLSNITGRGFGKSLGALPPARPGTTKAVQCQALGERTGTPHPQFWPRGRGAGRAGSGMATTTRKVRPAAPIFLQTQVVRSRTPAAPAPSRSEPAASSFGSGSGGKGKARRPPGSEFRPRPHVQNRAP